MSDVASLVVTLALDPPAQARFDAERERWFPAGRAQVDAHVTLFRAVPGTLEEQVRIDLVQAAGSPFPLGVAGVLPLTGGVAYALASPELARRHRALQQWWWEHLTAPDRRTLRPHVTVQSEAGPAEVRATLAVLRRGFRPYEVRADGYVLWRDDGGTWTELARVPFTDR